MAKLVAVCRDEEFPFERRQIPLMIEETLTMVMEIPETSISADYVSATDVSQFVKRYSCLTHNEMNKALMVGQKELFALLSISVPCVGCRRSVERLYNQLWESGQPAIEPLIITATGVLTLSEGFLFDAKLIYALFYIHGSHLNDVVDTLPKSRRNRRCILHSLETHKTRASSSWMDVWDLLSQECRDEVVLIDSDSLLDTLESYLRKHRFCSECKSKVLKAYSILSGDIDGDTEKGYCAALYEGLKSCPKDRHIHVICDTDFIAHLIGRAEPELAGGRRERHARTIDIAQEEVLTCLGIHLWERLHRLWQKLRAEEQTWQMLFYLGVEALRKGFETSIEDKQGISQLELVVEEISEAERAKEQRKENKRLKKKKRKENKAKLIEEKAVELEEEKSSIIENDEKTRNTNCADDDVVEYPESLEDSEKSSSESQVSPRKTDDDENETNVCSVSHCISPDYSRTNLLKICVDSSVPLPTGSSTCIDLAENCNHDDVNTNQFQPVSCKNESSKLKSTFINCKTKDTKYSTTTQSSCVQSKKVNSSHSSCCSEDSNRNGFPAKSSDQCRCEDSPLKPRSKRNGYHQEYRNNQYKSYNKRNGCHGCTSAMGPRFNRYEEHSHWKSDSGGGYQGDVYDKCYSMNGGGSINAHGRGKRKSQKNKELSNSYCQSSHCRHGQCSSTYNNSQLSDCVSSNESHPEVEDEDELRLLKSMGWTTEASLGLSDQEIQEYVANRRDVETGRQELREKLRDQFQKLSVNFTRMLPVNGVK